MLDHGKSGCVSDNTEQEIRKHLHDISNVLTILVGRAEILSKSKDLTEKDRKELKSIVGQGLACFEILEKTKEIYRKKAA